MKYLGSMVDSKGGAELDVRSRIRAGWAKCREVSSVIYFIYLLVLFILLIYLFKLKPKSIQQL